MLSLIPVPVRAALEYEFHLQVKIAYTKHLNDELVAFQSIVPQAALPSLPQIVTDVTPAKAEKPATETPGSIPGKRKASGTPTRFALIANATLAAITSAAVTAVATAVTTTAAATTAAAGTSPENALGVPGTSATNALEVPESDYDTNDTTPPRTFPKKEHGLTIIYGMDINNHLKSIKSDIRILIIKPEPGTPNTNYVNEIHFLDTVLTMTEAPVEFKNLLPQLTDIGSRKDVRTTDIIGFLTRNGVELTPLANDYEKITRTSHASPIIIEYSVTRHSFESTDLPASWLQLCILFQKEKLLVPFNQKGEAISL
jgi:hypothetical protein